MGMEEVIDVMDREGRIPDSDLMTWEDDIISSIKSITKE
jgi:hypothetical protein